jgi:hypothetical protein
MKKTTSKQLPLITKIAKQYLVFGIPLVLVSIFLLYFSTNYFLKDATTEEMNSTIYRIENALKNKKSISSLNPIYEIKKVEKLQLDYFKDTLIFDELQNEHELFNEFNAFRKIDNDIYKITVRDLVIESDNILITISILFSIILLTVYLAQFKYNEKMYAKIWSPFFSNLSAIRNFSIQNPSLNLIESDIKEFTQLNNQVKLLTDKVVSDYKNLKQFTEDLSHEMQTPLAIIQSKIELYLDNPAQSEQPNIVIFTEIQKNIKRLTKLNKGLLLLTKIDNQQFKEVENINVNSLIKDCFIELEDFYQIKNITISYTENAVLYLKMHKTLIEILITNLVSNAIKYTPINGTITVILKPNELEIKNSGLKAVENPSKLFNRFFKEESKSNSLGLGLSIVKKIVDYYHYTIIYDFKQKCHLFKITFK